MITDEEKYSTHLPILKFVLENANILRVFEYGCGNYSTKLFKDAVFEYLSVEQQSEDWYKKMSADYNVMYLEGGYKAIDYFKTTKQSWDLVFVDGHGDTRWLCIQEAMARNVPYIIAHDTEQPTYNWSKVINNTYIELRIKDQIPWTTIYTKDTMLINELARHFYDCELN
jgi:hypothetical protein